MSPPPGVAVRTARFDRMDPLTLYAVLKLRADVFVVEQRCVYPDLDGRDTEPGTRHVWAERGGTVLAYLRLLDDPGAARIGRVVTAPAARGTGLAGRLLAHAHDLAGDRPVVLAAQEHLAGWYARHGYAPDGPRFLEDGIWHVPMRRPAQGRPATSSATDRRRPV